MLVDLLDFLVARPAAAARSDPQAAEPRASLLPMARPQWPEISGTTNRGNASAQPVHAPGEIGFFVVDRDHHVRHRRHNARELFDESGRLDDAVFGFRHDPQFFARRCAPDVAKL